jgi:TonB family protein
MKKNLLVATITFLCHFVNAQAQNKEPYNDKQNIAVVTEQEPFYPKGDMELYKYVLHAVKYSEEAKQKFVEGEVMLSFDVLPDSTVNNTNVISGVCCGINEEVQRVVKELKFAPAMQNGIKIRMNVMMNFPVKAH